MMVECLARRIMAPFQGVLQIIRVGAGEAESKDGVHWILYAAHPDILAHSGLSEVRFGTWSADTGLRRAGALARLFRLYPKTMDERLIRVARVQARLQASQCSKAHYQEPFLWSE